MLYHCYADDTQIYLSVKRPNTVRHAVRCIEACLADMKSWMQSNMLKLNDQKTEFAIFSTRQLKDIPNISIGSHSISPSSMVRNLGIIMDRRLTMVNQVHQVVKVCNFYIRLIGKIRKYLTKESCLALTLSLVISRLDYGNSLLHGIAVRQITRLQRCQNTAARLVCQVRRREHITPTLMYLHWLPVSYRVMFKVLIFAFKALHGLGPKYLQELVTPHQTSRVLRSQNKRLAAVPAVRTVTYGHRTFGYAASTLWNNLPKAIRDAEDLPNFKKLLKTHFFEQAYSNA